jgi:hypothetical protein
MANLENVMKADRNEANQLGVHANARRIEHHSNALNEFLVLEIITMRKI